LYHPTIVRLCNVKEVAPSKSLILKAFIYLFYLFVRWFHNMMENLEEMKLKTNKNEDEVDNLEAD